MQIQDKVGVEHQAVLYSSHEILSVLGIFWCQKTLVSFRDVFFQVDIFIWVT